MKDPIVLCIYARKGGAGRTLIAQQLAGACAERGAKVLLIDQDPQGSLSKHFFGAAEALLDVKTRVLQVMQTSNVGLVDLGCFVTDFDSRNAIHKVAQQQIRQLYGSQVFDTVIKRRVAYTEAQFQLAPITHVKPTSEESEMIRGLLNEIGARITESREALAPNEKKVANQ